MDGEVAFSNIRLPIHDKYKKAASLIDRSFKFLGGGGGGLNSPSRRRLPEPATSLVSSFISPSQPLLTKADQA